MYVIYSFSGVYACKYRGHGDRPVAGDLDPGELPRQLARPKDTPRGAGPAGVVTARRKWL